VNWKTNIMILTLDLMIKNNIQGAQEMYTKCTQNEHRQDRTRVVKFSVMNTLLGLFLSLLFELYTACR
jgi:hypothetical protein